MSDDTQQNCPQTASRVIGIPFQPGDDPRRNLKGRPKKTWLTDVTEELLEQKFSDPVAREQFKEQMWAKLLSGKVVGAMTLDRVWERTEGKLTQPVDVSLGADVGAILEKWRNEK